MADTVFTEILQRAQQRGITTDEVFKSRKWFRNKAKELGSPGQRKEIEKDSDRFTQKHVFGKMYFFAYDPKHKRKLPYYDRFPLVFPIESRKNGFLGINLHYLPPILRAQLMDALWKTRSNNKFDKTTRLLIDYDILNTAATYKNFKPCVKHYLKGHMKSPLINIASYEWEIALFMPWERFVKKSSGSVWADSRKIIRG